MSAGIYDDLRGCLKDHLTTVCDIHFLQRCLANKTDPSRCCCNYRPLWKKDSHCYRCMLNMFVIKDLIDVVKVIFALRRMGRTIYGFDRSD